MLPNSLENLVLQYTGNWWLAFGFAVIGTLLAFRFSVHYAVVVLVFESGVYLPHEWTRKMWCA